MDLDQNIARHYEHGALEKAILDALKSTGKDPDQLTAADLAPVDEFHIGGRQATMDLAAQVDLPRGARVLDVGSGIGGPPPHLPPEPGRGTHRHHLPPGEVPLPRAVARPTRPGGVGG